LSSGIAALALLLICAPTAGMPTWMDQHGGRAAVLATRVLPVLFNTVSFQVTGILCVKVVRALGREVVARACAHARTNSAEGVVVRVPSMSSSPLLR